MPLTSLAKPENQSRAARCLKCLECCRCLNRITLQCPLPSMVASRGLIWKGGVVGPNFRVFQGSEPAGHAGLRGTPPSSLRVCAGLGGLLPPCSGTWGVSALCCRAVGCALPAHTDAECLGQTAKASGDPRSVHLM